MTTGSMPPPPDDFAMRPQIDPGTGKPLEVLEEPTPPVADSSKDMIPAVIGSGVLSSLVGSISQSNAMRTRGAFESSQASLQAGISRMQAAGALEKGNFEARSIGRRTSQIAGAQAASAGAQGISSPTAQIAATEGEGNIDALTVHNNAWRQAWGYDVQAEQQEFKGKMAGETAETEATQTLLTGGLSAMHQGLRDWEYASGNRMRGIG